MMFLFSKRESGFTLIEIIVSIGILGLIAGAVIAFESGLLSNTKILQNQLTMQQQVRRAMSGFVKDVRSARQSASGTYPIEISATNTLVFYANIDSDALIERVRYYIATSSLMRGVIKPTGMTYLTANEKTSILVGNVLNGTSTDLFSYYDEGFDGFTASSTAPIPPPINIPIVRMIQMSIVANPNGVRTPAKQTYTTQVSIRNLKGN